MKQTFKTKNISDILLKESQIYIEELKKLTEVIGIVVTGGIARGFADEFSDVDIEVFLHNKDYIKWEKNPPIELNRMINGKEIVEIEFFDYEDYLEPKNDEYNWTLANRWDKTYANIVYDPENKIKDLLSSKVMFRQNELERLLCRSHKYAYWYGFMVTESWIARGDIISAQISINYAVDNLIDYIYLSNKKYFPHMKWKYYYVKELETLPDNFSNILDELVLKNIYSEDDIKRKFEIFQILFRNAEKSFGC